MTGSRKVIFLVWIIALALSCSAAIPLKQGNRIAVSDEADEDVKALHAKSVSVSESAVLVNGERSAQKTVKEEVRHNGQQVAYVEKDKVELPHQPVHEFLKIDIPSVKVQKVLEAQQQHQQQGNGLKKRNLDEENWDSRDTPRDMAEYIFWTGDEASVTSAIRDFLRQGLLTQTEAIGFLEEVRYHLHQMQQRYRPALQDANEEKGFEKNSDELIEQIAALNKPSEQSYGAADDEKEHEQELAEKADKHQGQIIVKTFLPHKPSPPAPAAEKTALHYSHETDQPLPEKNDNTLEKMQLAADYLTREYGLEEIIYQLARALFTQSGNKAEAEESLQKFAILLDEEAQKGHITVDVQKKVLDVLLASLIDTVGEKVPSTKATPVMKH